MLFQAIKNDKERLVLKSYESNRHSLMVSMAFYEDLTKLK